MSTDVFSEYVCVFVCVRAHTHSWTPQRPNWPTRTWRDTAPCCRNRSHIWEERLWSPSRHSQKELWGLLHTHKHTPVRILFEQLEQVCLLKRSPMAFPAHWSFLISPTNKNADGSNSGGPLLTLIVSHVINILLRPEPAAGSIETKKESATMQLECSYGRHLFQPWLKIDVSACQSFLI